MSLRRKLILASTLSGAAAATWIAYGILHTVRHIPEAYAAWDTGTLLIEYMNRHDNRWPASWDDLLTVLDHPDHAIPLRGASANDVPYARSLREKVAIDWTFDPRHPNARNPVTRPDGTPFPVTWQGAEPNAMIRAHLTHPPQQPKTKN
jgi:hypothetical protein